MSEIKTNEDDQKTIARMQKLLRLAARSSGAPEAERISAGLAAANLFVALEDKAKKKGEDVPQPTLAEDVPWFRSYLSSMLPPCVGIACTRGTRVDLEVWMRIKNGEIEWMHQECRLALENAADTERERERIERERFFENAVMKGLDGE